MVMTPSITLHFLKMKYYKLHRVNVKFSKYKGCDIVSEYLGHNVESHHGDGNNCRLTVKQTSETKIMATHITTSGSHYINSWHNRCSDNIN